MTRLAVVLAALALAPAASGAALFPRQRMEAEYRQAAALWANEEEDAALAVLARLATQAQEGRPQATLERAKRAVARALGNRHPAALMSLARMETRAYHQEVTAKRPTVALSARRLAADLAGQHAARGGGRAASAALLGTLGGHLHLAAQEAAAEELYERALALEPRQHASLLGLAALREKRGHYAEAVRLLGAVTPPPGGREGRLRLAVNLLRIGRRDDGEAMLRALAAEGADWVRSVAAQELAKALVARGELAGARELVSAAALAVPCDPSLAVQATLLAERAGAASPLDLASLAECAEASIAPRARYTRPPTAEVRALLEWLQTLEAGWRESLRQALGQRRR